MDTVIYSFGFKHGVPIDANVLWDVRFLPNPYWQEELRPLSGMESQVSDFVIKSDQGLSFLDRFKPLIEFLIENQDATKNRPFRIAIGCTGGRHRSVAVVEELGGYLSEQGVEHRLFHRDLDKR